MSTQINSEHGFVEGKAPSKNNSYKFLSMLFSGLHAWYRQQEVRHHDRQAIKQLLQSEDHELLDIGITRDAVIWASKLPPDLSSTAELQKISRGCSKNK